MKIIDIINYRLVMIVGAIIMVVGSFLPWWESYETLIYYPGMKNGGIVSLLLAGIIFTVTIFWQNSHNSTFSLIVGLISISCFSYLIYKETIKWGSHAFEAHLFGPGFLLCLLGSLLSFIAALLQYRTKTETIAIDD